MRAAGVSAADVARADRRPQGVSTGRDGDQPFPVAPASAVPGLLLARRATRACPTRS